ncbi:tetratricopeptide repeat protein [Candidatus Pelagibacter sp.]|nr:tetratricopeptide repeat protein [Candidatus Pelagibacter sp.]
MKKIVITLFLVLFTSSVYAGSCPMMAKNLDDKIAEAQTLRDQGMSAHDAGDHAKSEELLNKALDLFKS